MKNLRSYPRYPAFAHARILTPYEEEALLRDLSVTGCCIEFTAMGELTVGDACELIIIPEVTASVAPFMLETMVCWCHANYDTFDVGFSICVSPKGKKFFMRYVNYLAWRTASKS